MWLPKKSDRPGIERDCLMGSHLGLSSSSWAWTGISRVTPSYRTRNTENLQESRDFKKTMPRWDNHVSSASWYDALTTAKMFKLTLSKLLTSNFQLWRNTGKREYWREKVWQNQNIKFSIRNWTLMEKTILGQGGGKEENDFRIKGVEEI